MCILHVLHAHTSLFCTCTFVQVQHVPIRTCSTCAHSYKHYMHALLYVLHVPKRCTNGKTTFEHNEISDLMYASAQEAVSRTWLT